MANLKTVSPGDLISADFMNGLVALVDDLQARVTTLESQQTTVVNRPRIDGVSPTGGLKVNATITLIGQNFVTPSPSNKVTIGGKPADVKLGGSPTQIRCDIPVQSTSLDPNAGTSLPIVVTNENGASLPFSIVVKPFVEVPHGTLSAAYNIGPAVAKLVAGKVVFGFELNAVVGLAARYRASASMDGSGWSATFLDDADAPIGAQTDFDLPDHAKQALRVQVTVPAVPAAGSTADSRLTINYSCITADAQVLPTSSQLELVFNSAPPQAETRALVSLRSADPDDNKVQLKDGKIQFTRNVLGNPEFNVDVQVAGNFEVSFAVRNATGWTKANNAPVKLPFIAAAPSRQFASSGWTAGAGAADSDLLITVTHLDVPTFSVTYALPISVAG